MIDGCLKIFEMQPDIDKRVLETYVPADGTYIVMKYDGIEFSEVERLELKLLDKKERVFTISPQEIERISKYDYYCKLVDMNKPIDSKKIIQSNSYLSFTIKKESLINGKLTEEIIDKYYDVLNNPYVKYTKKQDRALYASVEEEIGEVNVDNVELVRTWVKNNIFNLDIDATKKDYLKIFFVIDGTSFEAEGKRYYVPNIYNKNDYNLEIDGRIHGLPNNNMGLNAKKVYLEHKSRKVKPPIFETADRVMLKKKFFDYLLNLAAMGKYNVYFDVMNSRILSEEEFLRERMFAGYYLRLVKEKNEAAIVEADVISGKHNKLNPPLLMQNILDIEEDDKIEYVKIREKTVLKQYINNILFSNYLLTNLYNEASDMSIKDNVIKKNIVLYRNAIINWLDKNSVRDTESIVDKISASIIRNSIRNGHMNKACQQYNFRWSLLEYFRGGVGNMADVLREKREKIRCKINSENDSYIESDEEFYYALGQAIYYFCSLSEKKDKTYALANVFFDTSDLDKLKEKLVKALKKYNYKMKMMDKSRSGLLLSMIFAYVPENKKVMKDIMWAGYLSKNLVYEKKEGGFENE